MSLWLRLTDSLQYASRYSYPKYLVHGEKTPYNRVGKREDLFCVEGERELKFVSLSLLDPNMRLSMRDPQDTPQGREKI